MYQLPQRLNSPGSLGHSWWGMHPSGCIKLRSWLIEGTDGIVIPVSHRHLGGLGPAVLESVLASACLNPCFAAWTEQLVAVNANEEHMTPFLPVTLCFPKWCVLFFFSFIFKSAKSENQQVACGWALLGTTRNQVHVTVFTLLEFTNGHFPLVLWN